LSILFSIFPIGFKPSDLMALIGDLAPRRLCQPTIQWTMSLRVADFALIGDLALRMIGKVHMKCQLRFGTNGKHQEGLCQPGPVKWRRPPLFMYDATIDRCGVGVGHEI
jgi:hypothetical protein